MLDSTYCMLGNEYRHSNMYNGGMAYVVLYCRVLTTATTAPRCCLLKNVVCWVWRLRLHERVATYVLLLYWESCCVHAIRTVVHVLYHAESAAVYFTWSATTCTHAICCKKDSCYLYATCCAEIALACMLLSIIYTKSTAACMLLAAMWDNYIAKLLYKCQGCSHVV